MIAYVKGVLDFKGTDFVVVEAKGIGYKIQTPLPTVEKIGQKGDVVRVYTYLYVREDALNLYGFITQEEKSTFELLISVSGIGPKAALSLLSTVSPSSFALAVITDDTHALMKAQGVGKKTAQRVILELKDKIKKEQLVDASLVEAASENGNESGKEEAISALMVLGYTSFEARRAVSSVFTEDMDMETIIKKALKLLSK